MRKALSYLQKSVLREFAHGAWAKPTYSICGSTLRSLVKRGLLESRIPHGIVGIAVGLMWATEMEYRLTQQKAP